MAKTEYPLEGLADESVCEVDTYFGGLIMEVEQYTNGRGELRFRPVVEDEDEMLACSDENAGFCLGCGAEAYGVEPDARGYPCDNCEEELVYGFEELLLMGLVVLEGEGIIA